LGMHGFDSLVPWFWTSIVTLVVSFILLLIPSVRKDYGKLRFICVAVFLGIWIEKGMGLLIPGSIPTPIGEFSIYLPTLIEITNCLGNWAVGLLILTLLLKGSIGILLGEMRYVGPR